MSPTGHVNIIFGNNEVVWGYEKDAFAFMHKTVELWNEILDIYNQK